MKKRKMDIYDIIKLDSAYYKVDRFPEVDGVKGHLYYFDKMTQSDVEKIESFNNTRIMNGKREYAPEQKFKVLFVGQKCF